MKKIKSIEELEAVYGPAVDRAKWKEIDHINKHYRQFIERSPFLILATYGANGIDCSPRGDPAGFVRVVSSRCLQLPDRRGNNRLDSMRNILTNPQVGLIFLIPGIGETIRVSGKAEILVEDELCDSFSINGKSASSVISISVDKAYFQCQKAIVRSQLWSSSEQLNRSELPSTGEMIKEFALMYDADFDAKHYDDSYSENMKNTIY